MLQTTITKLDHRSIELTDHTHPDEFHLHFWQWLGHVAIVIDFRAGCITG